jgi:hypothetical protein
VTKERGETPTISLCRFKTKLRGAFSLKRL